MRRTTTIAATLLATAAVGCGSDEAEQAATDWTSRTGNAWQAFAGSYESGFAKGCAKLFARSTSGKLVEQGRSYTVQDCLDQSTGDAALASNLPADPPANPVAVGQKLGIVDGCRALFDQAGAGRLKGSGESLVAVDCENGTVDRPAPAPKSTPKNKTTTTSSSATGGTPARTPTESFSSCDGNIQRNGTTSCELANNAFYEYYQSGRSSSISAWSPAAGRFISLSCSPGGTYVTCRAGSGEAIRLRSGALDIYSDSQAASYAATHDVGPQ